MIYLARCDKFKSLDFKSEADQPSVLGRILEIYDCKSGKALRIPRELLRVNLLIAVSRSARGSDQNRHISV